MSNLYSHTLAQNDQPFGNLVLRQVIPYVEKMFITISEKSNDGTYEVIENLAEDYPKIVEISFENVANKSELTKERQKQLDETPNGKWILFLDMDDYWSTKSLENITRNYLNQDVDGLAVRPYQVIDKQYYDMSWKDKWFTKFFKKQEGLHYKNPWPRDLLYLNDQALYWKTNKRVPCIIEPYFHLSNIKYSSFRKEKGFEKYDEKIGSPYFIPELYKKEMEKIFNCL